MDTGNSGEGSGSNSRAPQPAVSIEDMLRSLWEQQRLQHGEILAAQKRLTETQSAFNERLAGIESKTPESSSSQMGGIADNAPQFAGPTGQMGSQGHMGPLGQQEVLVGTERRPRHTQGHTKEFTGKDLAEYPQFRGKLEAKLQIDAAAIGGMREMVWYAYGRLEDSASTRIWPWMSWAKDTPQFTLDHFFDEMDKAFSDPQRQVRALSAINTLRQGGKELRVFLNDLDRLMLEANGSAWDDTVKKGFLKAALDKKYLRALIGSEEAPSYRTFCDTLLRIDNQMTEVASLDRKHSVVAPTTGNVMEDAMDWQVTGDTSVSATRAQRQQPDNRPRAKWTPKEEVDRRRNDQLCLRCGSSEHYIRSCRFGPARKPESDKPGKKVQVAATRSKGGSEPRLRCRVVKRLAPGQSRRLGHDKEDLRKEWGRFQKKMEGPAVVVPVLVDNQVFAKTMIDTGCLSYGLCDPQFARKHQLQRMRIGPRTVSGHDGNQTGVITEVAIMDMDMEGYMMPRIFLYIVPTGQYDMILGMPWIAAHNVQIDGPRSEIRIPAVSGPIRSVDKFDEISKAQKGIIEVSATTFGWLSKRVRDEKSDTKVFAITMADINKALRVKVATDPRTKLPSHLTDYLDMFDKDKANQLPPVRGPGIDHSIKLIKDENGKEPVVPWGPLYGMSRDELLVLRKTLTELLDKGFIRVSNSPAAAPVLFVKKPGGGLRFCVDYRGLNKISVKDRYPLPLIYETLRNISRAKWYTKLDVVAAFHKIRITEGEEWKTAFRTRYGLYEWMVTPFGLANAPSTFQRYVNWALRDYLDEFCSAYIDDILIYTDGSLELHREQVRKVLGRLREAGLHLDIDKCEFEVTTTKYLGFIIETEKGIRMDPEKIQAITDWKAPTGVKGVRGFLGFANFYRKFIKDFADVARPLTDLTRKDLKFQWNDAAQGAFEQLKRIFIAEPVLAGFDYERETRVETDSSGWATGGTLMQLSDDKAWLPCAFFSKKNNPAECNYEIHDKEMLAIIRCLKEWKAELKGVKKFEILTDHKNLEYFMTTRGLTERQSRWAIILSEYNFVITHVPGTKNERADALSRRDQDMPKDSTDNRISDRNRTLLGPKMLASSPLVQVSATTTRGAKNRQDKELIRITQREDQVPEVQVGEGITPEVQVCEGTILGEDSAVWRSWDQAVQEDLQYQGVRGVLQSNGRSFPRELDLKVSVSECSLNLLGQVTYRKRLWIPAGQDLRTKLIQEIHDSMVTGHPGREGTYAAVARQFFWPNMSSDVRQLVRNCDGCAANKSWRDRRHGFLKPLPIPERIWKEISIDFVDKLQKSGNCQTIVVVTDRLSKGVLIDGLPDMEAETLAWWFIRNYYPYHYLPDAIVSDRGTQFTGRLWSKVCDILGITRRLSAAFSPETDGSTERMNQTMEHYLRQFCNYSQDDWYRLLPLAMLAINGREAASTGVSPFFLVHGWHPEPIRTLDDFSVDRVRRSPEGTANEILEKMKIGREWAQLSMAMAQDRQERQANRTRQQAPSYRVGDKVWLSLENMTTDRPMRKLDAKYAKYEVIEVIGSHNYRLNTPSGCHNVFPSRLLRPSATDPLPGQTALNPQPPGVLVDNEVEWEVENIQGQKRARGGGNSQQYLVKWKGYDRPTWEPRTLIEDTAALSRWEKGKGG